MCVCMCLVIFLLCNKLEFRWLYLPHTGNYKLVYRIMQLSFYIRSTYCKVLGMLLIIPK